MSKENISTTPRLDLAIKEMGLQPTVVAEREGLPPGAADFLRQSYAVNEVSTAPRPIR